VALQASLDYESSIVGDYYTIPKRTLEKAIINPFLYSSRGKDEYMIAAVCPIKYGKNFYGITGVNMKLSTFQKMVREHTDELDNYDVRIVSGSGDYVASNADVSLLGQNLADIESNSAEQLNDMVKAQRNVALEDDYIVAQVPIRFNTLPVVWMVKTKVPLSAILGEDDILRFLMILLGSLVLAFLVNFAIYFYIKSKTETLDNLYLNALAFSQGEEPRYLVKSEDESRFINDIVVETYSFMKQAEQVFVQVQEGDYKADFMPRNPRDSFAKKLNLMLEILHQRQTDNREKQRIAQDERWIRNGIAVINKVVRRQYNQYTELTENLITQVVDYLNINQGGIFVLIESETGKFTLELTSSYAYSKLKAYKKRVYLGDGIVGTCALEREITYLTEIPNDYSQIRSGVGGALPKAVLVAPLIHENVVYGVIELATFTFFNETEIEFIRAIAEPIAAAIASVKIADKTRELLDAMQLQQSELKDQEANMRSSLEKLEEIQRKAKLTEDRLRRELESAKLEILRLKTSTIVFDSNE
ncbi:MAG: Chemotaxis regulator BdlA, partial [Bacteroidota bacterium]